MIDNIDFTKSLRQYYHHVEEDEDTCQLKLQSQSHLVHMYCYSISVCRIIVLLVLPREVYTCEPATDNPPLGCLILF